jgi:hypothetical protein
MISHADADWAISQVMTVLRSGREVRQSSTRWQRGSQCSVIFAEEGRLINLVEGSIRLPQPGGSVAAVGRIGDAKWSPCARRLESSWRALLRKDSCPGRP